MLHRGYTGVTYGPAFPPYRDIPHKNNKENSTVLRKQIAATTDI